MRLPIQIVRLVSMVAVVMLVIACGAAPEQTDASNISVQPSSIPIGGKAVLTVEARGSALQFQWSALKGRIKDPSATAAEYTAPDTAGLDVVTVVITGSGGQIVKKIDLQIVDPAVSTQPTPTPTSIPVSAGATAQLTAAPATTAPSMTTVVPVLPATPVINSSTSVNMNIHDGDRVAQTMTLLGEYPADLQGDLWVFVAPPSGILYPQSSDACAGALLPKVDNKWELRVGFGGPDNVDLDFQLVVAEATKEASKVLSNTLKQWCKNKNFPGLDVLPDEVVQRASLTVTRSADRWGPAPDPSNAKVDGQVAFVNIGEGDKVKQGMQLKGTVVADASANLWILVYATNGRWFPQSRNACKGSHAHVDNGQWDVLAGFGGQDNVGEPFDVVAVLADANANAALDQKQREWCEAKNYPGFLTIELPKGIEQKAHVRVVRE